MFIEKQKRRLPRVEERPKKRARVQELVFSAVPKVATVTPHRVAYQCEIPYDVAADEPALERRQTNIIHSALLAFDLYLSPKAVVLTALYWLIQYANCALPERDWFNDLVEGVVRHPIRLSFTASEGICQESARMRQMLLLHFAGSPLHKVPTDYFIERGVWNFGHTMAHLTHPDNDCFLSRNAFGLRGELEAKGFVYDRVLSYFYEPSFYLLTLYMIYITALVHMTGGRTLLDWLPHIAYAVQPLEQMQAERVLALNTGNSNYERKWQLFSEDVDALRDALRHCLEEDQNVERLISRLESLWQQKAEFLEGEKWSRLETLLSQ